MNLTYFHPKRRGIVGKTVQLGPDLSLKHQFSENISGNTVLNCSELTDSVLPTRPTTDIPHLV